MDPKNPIQIDHVYTADRAFEICMSGRFGYVADGHGGLQVIDFAKANPRED